MAAWFSCLQHQKTDTIIIPSISSQENVMIVFDSSHFLQILYSVYQQILLILYFEHLYNLYQWELLGESFNHVNSTF